MNKDELLRSLQLSANMLHANRVERITKHPLKILSPYFMKEIGFERQTRSETFFGRKMSVMLPEAISVRIWRYGVFEEDVSFYLLSLLRPGDVFFDVGAHFGFFSMLARELVGDEGCCVAFEPMPRQLTLLEENLRENSVNNLQRIVPAALGSTSGRLRFKDFGLLGSAYATSKQGRNKEFKMLGEVDVEVRTLDEVAADLGLSNLRLIKIDAEDAEYDVIQGGLETIRMFRPAIIVEAGDFDAEDHSTYRVLELIQAQEYLFFEFKDWMLQPHKAMRDYEYQNVLCVPTERVSDMIGRSRHLVD